MPVTETKRDSYEILGVGRDATREQVKHARGTKRPRGIDPPVPRVLGVLARSEPRMALLFPSASSDRVVVRGGL